MQRCRPGFLRASQNEIDPLDLSQLGSPHSHESRTADHIVQSAIAQFRKTAARDVVDVFCNRTIRAPVLHNDEFSFEGARTWDIDCP